MKRNLWKICSVILTFAFCLLCACAPTGPKGSAEDDTYEITFDFNYEGAPDAVVKTVAKNDVPEYPSDPQRENYAFGGWFYDKEGTEEVDREVGITQDDTFYAAWLQTSVVVTIDPNYDGATTSTQAVVIGQTMAQPQTPSRGEEYAFTMWYTDAECTKEYDFSSVVSSEFTLYAGWEKIEGESGLKKVTFEYNFEDKGQYYEANVIEGRRVGKPADPQIEGYAFIGWYTEPECQTAYNFTSKVAQNMTLYGYWMKVYTFEAEYTDVSAIKGQGYSGEYYGKDIIRADNMDQDASNGYFLSCLYNFEVEVIFEIEAAEAVENAQLVLRLAGEVQDFMLTDETYLVQVNGENLKYGTMSFEGVTSADHQVIPFANRVITTSLNLKKGRNVIKLITNNKDVIVGTMYATAPQVDAITIYSNVALDWCEGACHLDNLDQFKN